jgi:predicted ATPase
LTGSRHACETEQYSAAEEEIPMLEYLRLRNVGPTPEMEMDLAPRLNLITGDNGLGKSFLLDVAWWALTRKWPQDLNTKLTSGYAARPTDIKKPATIEFRVTSKTKSVTYESQYVPREESWLGKAGRPWNPGLVIYAHSDGAFSVWDPARNYWKKKGNIDVQDRLPGYVFSAKEVWDGLEVEIDGKATVVCNGLLRDWASWIREDGALADNMREVLVRLSPSMDKRDQLEPGPLTRISVNDVRDIPSLRTGYAEAIPILHASSGVRRIVTLAYVLLWSWREHHLAALQLGEAPAMQVVLLIDELESHLHPRWQRSILGSLLKLASIMHWNAETIQIITATHSPLVLASAEPNFDSKKDAWFDLDLNHTKNGDQVQLQKRDFVRRGDVSSWLTSDAFDLKEPTSIEAEEAITKALLLLRKDAAPSTKEIDEVDRLLRKSLSDVDRFWVRWSQFRKTHEAGT